MSLIRKATEQTLVHEYGLSGMRTLPWDGMNSPFGSAYCVVSPGSSSLAHVNQPTDEDELFICIAGRASVIVGDTCFDVTQGDQIFIPRCINHYVDNDGDEPFVFFTVWWNSAGARTYLDAEAKRAGGALA